MSHPSQTYSGLPDRSYKIRLTLSVRHILSLIKLLLYLPLQPPHTSGETLFHAFAVMTPPTPRYVRGPEWLETQHFSSLRLEVSYCRFLLKTYLHYVSVALDSPDGLTGCTKDILWQLLCSCHCLRG